jgi:hypothetical protein
MIHHEMIWCVLYFKHQKDIWLSRTLEYGYTEGPKAYEIRLLSDAWAKFCSLFVDCLSGFQQNALQNLDRMMKDSNPQMDGTTEDEVQLVSAFYHICTML